jgi:signal transduction histidine kinase
VPERVDDGRDSRVLVLAPRGRDAALARDALAHAGLRVTICGDLDTLCGDIARGAGALLVAEEAITPARAGRLIEAVGDEPGWSELPIVVLLSVSASRDSRFYALKHLEPLRNVTLLDRPVRIAALVSTMRAALRARQRQYEIRDLMAELQQALRARDELVASVSHELRTPLNVILGWAVTLQQRADDPAQVAAAAKTIDRNTRILWQLVEDLIDVARIASGRVQLKMSDVDVGAIVAGGVETLRPTADARRVALDCRIDPALPPVRGDDLRLQQVIWNLVWNALKFTPAGGRIDVTVQRTRAGAVAVAVEDTGAGIDPAFLPHVFEPFRQAAQQTDPHRGLGLGLSIVRHIIELHGGTIAAESEGIGRGARFTVTLPASVATEPTRRPAPAERRDAPRAEPTHF